MSSYIDLILLIFLIYSAYQGYQTGFITALSKLLFVLVGILFSLFLAFKIKGIIYPGLIASPYLAIGILTLIFVAIVRKILKKLILFLQDLLKKTDLLWLDPILGAVLGVLKCYIIVFIIISIIASFNNKTLIDPILKSTVAKHMYSQVRRTTGLNLAKYLHDLSIKQAVNQVGETFNKTTNAIEN